MGNSSFRRHGLHTGPFARRAKVPWKECNQMDERLKFIARLLDGEKMAVLCRQFAISRKTGYKMRIQRLSESRFAERETMEHARNFHGSIGFGARELNHLVHDVANANS